jgi:hypothetical protein
VIVSTRSPTSANFTLILSQELTLPIAQLPLYSRPIHRKNDRPAKPPNWNCRGTASVIAIMNNQTEITLRRKTSYLDRLRSYKVKLDGGVIGSVRANQSMTLPISPGRHSIVLRIDWCGSKQVDFEIHQGEHVFFECGSNLAGWRILLTPFYIIFRTQQYLWLRNTAN